MDILQELLNNINAILQIEEADNERDKVLMAKDRYF